MRIPALALAFSLAALVGFAADAPATKGPRPDPWKPLRPLLGSWKGESKGQPGTGTSERTYAFALRERFVQAKNTTTYVPTEKTPKGEVHEDLGFFSFDRAKQKLVLRQFHVEGFVNTYELESVSADDRTLVFVTTAIENIAPGWRGRETYTLIGDDAFTEKFELAEPGKEFAVYSEARFTRQRR